MRGDNVELEMRDDFSGTFLDYFFLQELSEAKDREFVNLK